MEEFRDLDSYYAVSNLGRVKSKRRNIILSTHCDSKGKGYEYITLNYNGKKITRQVHRLVATLFLPNPHSYPCVNHKDENPHNNNVENLEWCTYSYNLSYGTKIQREHYTKQQNDICNAPKKVIQKDLDGNTINIFTSAKEAERVLGIAHTHIIDCCKNKLHIDSKKGYKWVTRTAGGYKFSWF